MSLSAKELTRNFVSASREDRWPDAMDALLVLAKEAPALVSNNLFWLRVRLPRFLEANDAQRAPIIARLLEAHAQCNSAVLLHIVAEFELRFGDRETGLELNRRAARANVGRKVYVAELAAGVPDEPDWHGPDYLVLGAQKTATSAVYKYLNMHYRILPAIRKELFFFSNPQLYSFGLPYYQTCFPPTFNGRYLTGEASASYFNNPVVMERVLTACTASKFIVTVRHPAERAISDYHMKLRNGSESRSIEEAIHAELDELSEPAPILHKRLRKAAPNNAYVRKGIYAFPFKYLLEQAGPARIHVVEAAMLKEQPATVLAGVCDFLGMTPINEQRLINLKPVNVGDYDRTVDPQLRQRLTDFYRPYNEQFFELVGTRYDW